MEGRGKVDPKINFDLCRLFSFDRYVDYFRQEDFRIEREGQEEYERMVASRGLQPELFMRFERIRKTEGIRREGRQVLDGFFRMQQCRDALSALDRRGWARSYHQREFHDDFLRACARIFWKTAPKGQFNRDHQRILEINGWDHLAQEILVSTPRRFGKTISVSMFAAAVIFSAPGVEVSIYSTCKRISQKLLRNIRKFLYLIYDELGIEPYKVIRMNMEEILLEGPGGSSDVRIVNSYPSKVNRCFIPLASCLLIDQDDYVRLGLAYLTLQGRDVALQHLVDGEDLGAELAEVAAVVACLPLLD